MENNYQSKNSFSRKLFVVSLIGFLFSVALFQINQKIVAKSVTNTASLFPIHPSPLKTGFPITITIPSIGVRAPMQYVTIEENGKMTAPNGPESVGWFDLGARPGEIGTAVIAGHSGYDRGVEGVFDKLHQMKVGETLQIQDDQGVIETFLVREIKNYDPNADASEVFRSYDAKAHLNLITCDGTWDDILKTHTERLVVFTERID